MKPVDPLRDAKLPPRLSQRPMMIPARMIVEVVENDRALSEILRPPGKRRGFFRQFLDQAVLVSGDNIHDVHR